MTPYRQRRRKRPIAQINVVPYIDVMLVLLVIFMITAPLLTQGVKVDLPQATAEALPAREREPLVLTVDARGRYYLNLGDKRDQPETSERIAARVAAVLRRYPQTQVLVKADRHTEYGVVVRAMALLQSAGAPGIGLMTEPPLQHSPGS
jgi:biopolymer transport protein TolR